MLNNMLLKEEINNSYKSFDFILDDELNLISISKNAQLVFGNQSKELETQKNLFNSIVHFDDIAFVQQKRQFCLENNLPQIFDYRIFTKNARYKKVREEICCSKNKESGNVILEGIVTDISKSSEIVLQQGILRALNNELIISITNINGRIVYANDNFCKISQYSLSELVGKTHQMVNSGFHPKSVFIKMRDTILSGKTWRGEIKNKAKDGTYYWTESCVEPIFDENNKILYFISLRNLITDKKISKDKEKLLQRELDDSQKIGKVGNWSLNCETQELIWSKGVYIFFEKGEDYIPNLENFLNMVHPDDKDLVKKNLERALNKETVESEYRIIVNNKIKWIHGVSSIQEDQKIGDVNIVVGSAHDITQLKEYQIELERKNKKIQEIVQNIPVTITQLSPEYEIIFSNYNHKENGGINFLNHIAPEFQNDCITKFTQANISGKDVSIELKGFRDSQEAEWFRLAIKKVVGINEKYDYTFLVIARNISAEKLIQENVIRASIESEERERKRIATELHDGICQNLVALKMISSRMGKENPSLLEEKNNNNAYKVLNDLIASTLVEIRRCSYDLMPIDIVQEGLFGSLKNLFIINNAASSINHILELNAVTEPSQFVAINIYRIVQEFIQNSQKHSKCTEIHLRISENKHHLIFKLSDNGQGFPKTEDYKSGIGVLSMLGRIKNIGATHNIITNSGEGVQLFFSINIH